MSYFLCHLIGREAVGLCIASFYGEKDNVPFRRANCNAQADVGVPEHLCALNNNIVM